MTRTAQVLSERAAVLRPAAPSALARLQLSAEEGFLLSRLDRPMKVSDVLVLAGLPEARALQVLENLADKGALLLPGEDGPAPAAAPAEPARGRWGDFVFSPGELAEDVDLDVDKRKHVLFLFHTLDEISHYRLLGVDPRATSAEVRKAYLERSKQFHPDNFFRARLGKFAPKIDAIFQRLKFAHDTLADEESRHRYEREAVKLFTPEERSAVVMREIEALEEETRQKGRRGRLMHARGFVRLTRAREVMADGDAALARGDLMAASAAYQLAGDLDPRLDEARQKLVEARRVALTRRADMALAEAGKLEAAQKPDRALELLRSAVDVDPSHAGVHLAYAALLLRSADEDPREARVHAQKAVDLGEKSGAARLVLGEALLRCGLKKNARRELEAALEAGEARAAALLKQC